MMISSGLGQNDDNEMILLGDNDLGFFKVKVPKFIKKGVRLATYPVKLSLKLASKAAKIGCGALGPALAKGAAAYNKEDPQKAENLRKKFCRYKRIGDKAGVKRLLPQMTKLGAQMELAKRREERQQRRRPTRRRRSRRPRRMRSFRPKTTFQKRLVQAMQRARAAAQPKAARGSSRAALRRCLRECQRRHQLRGTSPGLAGYLNDPLGQDSDVLLTEEEARALMGLSSALGNAGFGNMGAEVTLTQEEADALMGAADDPETVDDLVLLGILGTPDEVIIEALEGSLVDADDDDLADAMGVTLQPKVARGIALGLTAVATGLGIYGVTRR